MIDNYDDVVFDWDVPDVTFSLFMLIVINGFT